MKIQKLREDIEAIDSLEPFWNRINQELQRFGVTSIMYGAIATKTELEFGARTQSMIWKTNHGSEFFERFCTPGRDDSIDNCLTYEHTLTSTEPFIWHDFDMWEGATPKQAAHALAARELGLFVGFTVSTQYFGKDRFGAISVSVGDRTLEGFYEMWESDREELLEILAILDTGMRETYLAEVIGLAPREKQTVEYFAAGLRAKEVAARLGVGVKTIEKNIESARKKLKAKNRDQAIAKALVFNVI
jgi:DNA-binding CsgD family transcriptional regulator